MTGNSCPPPPPPMRARSGARPSPTPRSQRPDRGVGDCLEPWSNWRGAGWPGGESSEQVRVSSAVELVRTREVGDKREGRTRTNGRGSRGGECCGRRSEEKTKRRRGSGEEEEAGREVARRMRGGKWRRKREEDGRGRNGCTQEGCSRCSQDIADTSGKSQGA